MGLNEQIATAFGAHTLWKARLQRAAVSRRSEFKPEDVARDDLCTFGKWLHDPSATAGLRDSEGYRTVLALHAEFHRTSGATLAKALSGDRQAAADDLENGNFARVSQRLYAAMFQWQRSAAASCARYGSGLLRRSCMALRGRLGLRVWATIIMPSLAAWAGLIYIDLHQLQMMDGSRRMNAMVGLLAESVAAVHELQSERGLSAAVAARPGSPLAADRNAQLAATDTHLAALHETTSGLRGDAGLAEPLRTADAAVQSAIDLRPRIESGTIAAAEVIRLFSTAIDGLLALNEASLAVAADHQVYASVVAFTNLSRAKDYAGQERATAAAALAAGDIGQSARQRLIELAALQTERLSTFLAGANAEHKRLFAESTGDPAFAAMDALRKKLLTDAAADMTPEAWFTAASARIDLLKRMEDRMIADIRRQAAAVDAAEGERFLLFNACFGVATLFGVAVVVYLARGITLPVLRLSRMTRQLAQGDLEIKIPATERPDEIGEMARAVLVFQQQAVAVERIAALRETERDKNENDRRDALLGMAENIEGQTAAVVGRLIEGSRDLRTTAKRMAAGATRVEQNSQRVAAAADQSLSNARSVAGAAERLSESIREIGTQVDRSRLAVDSAVQTAGRAWSTVGSLGEAMVAIDQVVSLIADIASQTNLLALNATIEAARAGESGKGFAVVAHEVKLLATQTARQTEDINRRIGTLKEMAERVGAAIQETTESIQGVEAITNSVAAAVEQQEVTTHEISDSVQQSARAAQDVTQRIAEVAAEAVTTGKQAGDVESNLEGMAQQMDDLGHMLNRIVRTATPEVDRRTQSRHAVTARVKLTLAQGDAEGELADISTTVARVTGLPPARQGDQAVFQLGGARIPATILESTETLCRLRLDATGHDAIRRWIDQQDGSTRAA